MSPLSFIVDIALELGRSKVQERKHNGNRVKINMVKKEVIHVFFRLGSRLVNCNIANKGSNRKYPKKDSPAMNWKLRTV